jgi:hypothetical protein
LPDLIERNPRNPGRGMFSKAILKNINSLWILVKTENPVITSETINVPRQNPLKIHES